MVPYPPYHLTILLVCCTFIVLIYPMTCTCSSSPVEGMKDCREIVLYNFTLRGEKDCIVLCMNESFFLHMQNRNTLLEFDELIYTQFANDIYVDEIVRQIRQKTDDKDDQARIAISLVQHIPYDFDAPRCPRTMAEVIGEKKGDCDEKSMLLAKLLGELGFGTSYFWYVGERHMNVGLKCPDGYDYWDTGYAIVESTNPVIPTLENPEQFPTRPVAIPVSGGDSFKSIREEYMDAFIWNVVKDDIMSGNEDGESVAAAYSLCEKYGF